jgi:hypothetical protein
MERRGCLQPGLRGQRLAYVLDYEAGYGEGVQVGAEGTVVRACFRANSTGWTA